ncbi:site-specific integrase [Rossellomorea vietnamensis]|uniref:site-specific integrase n=1 Tax=Rossellomorea vietnamensis TaxID=218284 RepID=UPI003D2E736C
MTRLHRQNFKGATVDVQPLRNKEDILKLKQALRRWSSERDAFMFSIGVNTGLRVSDILQLRVEDVRGKSHVIICEKKTGKPKRFMLTKSLQEEVATYTNFMNDEDYLFPSRKGDKPISTTQAYRSLTKAAEMADIESVGTHTMRKTFGYHYYKKTKDVAKLQYIFNHSAPSVTLRYIGVTQDEIDETLEDFYL